MTAPPRTVEIGKLHPSMQRPARELLNRIEQRGLPFMVWETFRTVERQAWLYACGRTIQNPDVPAGTGPHGLGTYKTNAQGKDGPHTHGLALDCVIDVRMLPPALRGVVTGGWDIGPEAMRLWRQYGELAESVDLEWGGTWRFRDLPHVQRKRWHEIAGVNVKP